MNEELHISKEQLVSLSTGELTSDDEAGLRQHLEVCEECRAGLIALGRFTDALDAGWNAERLASLGLAHPTAMDLESYCFGEAPKAISTAIHDHLENCEVCTKHMERLNEGLNHLTSLDPLSQPAWSEAIGRKFAAGIEMIVEAAHGAYTSASGLVRDAMTPQTTARLTPSPAVAMGQPQNITAPSAFWHNAAFVTDEVSGEVSGSSDRTTGRGIITVVIHKSGEYVAAAPIVDLVSDRGAGVMTQSGLDMGDRYTATFPNLDEGRYLVGIRGYKADAG
ncbi:MAG TPA: zf-HC2 domain-containing protein [Armatimonadota bacterium]|jgi:hypothetical protein